MFTATGRTATLAGSKRARERAPSRCSPSRFAVPGAAVATDRAEELPDFRSSLRAVTTAASMKAVSPPRGGVANGRSAHGHQDVSSTWTGFSFEPGDGAKRMRPIMNTTERTAAIVAPAPAYTRCMSSNSSRACAAHDVARSAVTRPTTLLCRLASSSHDSAARPGVSARSAPRRRPSAAKSAAHPRTTRDVRPDGNLIADRQFLVVKRVQQRLVADRCRVFHSDVTSPSSRRSARRARCQA